MSPFREISVASLGGYRLIEMETVQNPKPLVWQHVAWKYGTTDMQGPHIWIHFNAWSFCQSLSLVCQSSGLIPILKIKMDQESGEKQIDRVKDQNQIAFSVKPSNNMVIVMGEERIS